MIGAIATVLTSENISALNILKTISTYESILNCDCGYKSARTSSSNKH